MNEHVTVPINTIAHTLWAVASVTIVACCLLFATAHYPQAALAGFLSGFFAPLAAVMTARGMVTRICALIRATHGLDPEQHVGHDVPHARPRSIH